jgi:ATP-dependent Clp protease ATP-binding subunit ClpB
VILLDEVEKAHGDVFNVLLQVLDDGRMTDGQGRTVDFRNTVIVMTSNLGSHEIHRLVGEDSETIREAVMGEVRAHFRPEFINRIDEIVVFRALERAQIESIARIQLRRLEARLAAQDMKLVVSDAAVAELAKTGFDPAYGARPLKRAIQRMVENPIAMRLLEGKIGPRDVVPVDFRGGEFTFERTVH